MVNETVVLFNGTLHSGLANATPNDAPGAMAVDPGAGLLFVANALEPQVSVVNLSSGRVEGTLGFPSDGELGSLAFDPRSNELYGTDASFGYLDAVNLSGNQTAAAQIPVGSPQTVVYDAPTGEIAVTAGSWDSLLLFNGTNHTRLGNYSTSSSPEGVAIFGSPGRAYVSEPLANLVQVFNLTSGNRSNVSVGVSPTGVVADPTNSSVVITDYGTNQLTVINGSSLATRNVVVGAAPTAIVYDGPDGRLFVVDSGDSNLTVLYASNGSVSGSIHLGGPKAQLAI
ncbi:MAG: hypothetical protein L3J72_04210, partial [Thermoplasmata archaeon]|nr:hypothetical protein [Thermoplasmata archaeon]